MSVLFFDGEADPPDPTWQGEFLFRVSLDRGRASLVFLTIFIPLSSRSTLSPLASPLLLSLSHLAGFTASSLPDFGPPTTAVSPHPCNHTQRVAVKNALTGASCIRVTGLAATASTLRTHFNVIDYIP